MRPFTPESFWAKVDTSAGLDGCWPRRAAEVRGYGVVRVHGKYERAHRVAWWLTRGSIPSNGPGYHGWCICHHCDSRNCVNPVHLFIGTAKDNSDDRDAKGRQAKGESHGWFIHPELRPVGEQNGNAILTVQAVRKIRKELSLGKAQVAIAAKYRVSRSTIQAIKSGRSWGSSQ